MASSINPRNAGRARASQKENQQRQVKGLSAINDNRETGRAHKRTVLGSITNNVRIQPSRAAKTAHDLLKGDRQDENACVALKAFGNKSRNQPFSIYVDQDPASLLLPDVNSVAKDLPEDDIENQLPPVLNAAVMRLPSISNPAVKASYLLDMSGVEEEANEIESDDECEMLPPPDEPKDYIFVEDTDEELDREAVIEEVPEYSEDIYSYLLSVESKNSPRPGFMRRQQDVTLQMRSILVDWLVEVAEEYKLQRETLFLTVTYIDRFLSQMSVLRSKLQLVGAAAMFLAAKYEEIYPPDVNEFVYITDDTYQKKQILRMEHLILKVLKFDVATPTINWFTERLLRQMSAPDNVKHLTMYITELVLVEYDKYLIFPSSMVAASALCLAQSTISEVDACWLSQYQSVSRYSLNQLDSCLRMLYELLLNAPNHPQQAVREKYRLPKFEHVAELSPRPLPCLV